MEDDCGVEVNAGTMQPGAAGERARGEGWALVIAPKLVYNHLR